MVSHLQRSGKEHQQGIVTYSEASAGTSIVGLKEQRERRVFSKQVRSVATVVSQQSSDSRAGRQPLSPADQLGLKPWSLSYPLWILLSSPLGRSPPETRLQRLLNLPSGVSGLGKSKEDIGVGGE